MILLTIFHYLVAMENFDNLQELTCSQLEQTHIFFHNILIFTGENMQLLILSMISY